MEQIHIASAAMLNIVHLSTKILDLVAVELSLDHEHDYEHDYEHELEDSFANRLERNTNLTIHLKAIGKGICR